MKALRESVREYCRVKDVVRLSAGDSLGRSYDADLRYILDTYVKAGEVEIVGVVDELIAACCDVGEAMGKLGCDDDARAEIIERNLAREIIIRQGADPVYYASLSSELEKLILRRKMNAVDNAEYVREMSELARKILGELRPFIQRVKQKT